MAFRKVCYRNADGMVVTVKDITWIFYDNETSGNFSVVILDLTQEQLADIDLNRIPISDETKIGSLIVNDPEDTTDIVRVTE